MRASRLILIVDDDPWVLGLAGDILAGEGYAVLRAAGAEEALRMAGRHAEPIHLLLTDVVMPGMNGRDLADRLRLARPEIKVLYMSAWGTEELRAQGIVLPEGALVRKPFTVKGLAQRVRETVG